MLILRRAFREQLKVYLDSKCISTLLTKKLLFLCKHDLSHNSHIVEARKLSCRKKQTKTKHEYKRQNFHQMTASTTLPLPSTGRQNAEQISKANVFRTALTHIPDTLRPQSFTPIHNLSTTTTVKPSYCSCQMVRHEELSLIHI